MNNFRIPPSSTWFVQPVCSPENGLLYIAGNNTSIAYIPPVKDNEQPNNGNQDALNVRIIQVRNKATGDKNHQPKYKQIDCDPNWSSTKWFVTMNEDNAIWVWNLETERVCRGHVAHIPRGANRKDMKSFGGTMCITKDRQVVSIDRHLIVRYCLASNTYTQLKQDFIKKGELVTQLKASPYHKDIIAVGYKNGLISIANLAEESVLRNLRGHDSEIVSLQWTQFSLASKNDIKREVESVKKATIDAQEIQYPHKNVSKGIQSKPETPKVKPNEMPKAKPKEIPNEASTSNEIPNLTPKAIAKESSKNRPKAKASTSKCDNRRGPLQQICDIDDIFGIHDSFSELPEEFGTISSRPSYSLNTTIDDANTFDGQKAIAINDGHDYSEECKTMREEIISGNLIDSDDLEDNEANEQCAVTITDIENMKKRMGLQKDDSFAISQDDNFSNHSTISSSSFVNIDDSNQIDEMAQVHHSNEETENSAKDLIFLASGSDESFIIIWNSQTGEVCDRIQLKSHGRNRIPRTNSTIAWVRSNQFFVNGPDGRISLWKALESSTQHNLKFAMVTDDYPDTAVTNICSSVEYDSDNPIIWTFSTHLRIIGHRSNDQFKEISANYATLPIGMFALSECPHDPTKLAIAGNNKRISIIDLSTLKVNNIEAQSLTSKVQGKVLALEWHPSNENLISFSTNEGRVGEFNISKTTSPPELMKNFNGNDMYALSYGEDTETKKTILYAANRRKLMMFDGNSTRQEDHKSLVFSVPVSAVKSNNKYIAIGLSDGTLKILLNNDVKTEILSEPLSKKYISDLSWSTKKPGTLAAATHDGKIFIFEKDEQTFKQTSVLTGHNLGVISVNWSSQTEHKLVSAGYDHTVRVWNTETLEYIAWVAYESKMCCATFLPTDENFVVCSGSAETMHIFEIEKHLVAKIGAFDMKKKPSNEGKIDLQWATQNPNLKDIERMQKLEMKKMRKMIKKLPISVDEVAESFNAIALAPSQSSPQPSTSRQLATPPISRNNLSTFLYLSNKELNNAPLDHLERLVTESLPDGNGDKVEKSLGKMDESVQFLHGKLFGKRNEVSELLNEELENHRKSKTDSIGNLLIPQVNSDLKALITKRLEEKRLTELELSLAPSISHRFWVECTEEYANQCIEKGLVMQAVPHLLAVKNYDLAIDKLCTKSFYREAWCIAKMFKEPGDEVFKIIAIKWAKELESTGCFEAAALISFLMGKPSESHRILNRRNNSSNQIENIIEQLANIPDTGSKRTKGDQ